MSKEAICIIPARGGSKRIPRKNIKEFNGKPIIAYSIEAALKSNCFSQVIVSTDDDEISEVAKKYRIKNINDKKEFLIKVNTIPVSLVLAQAALESGWGKSRFVRKANNIFGHWSYSGDGLIPLRRDAKAKHRIKIFKSLQDAIKAYLRNINTLPDATKLTILF